MRNALLAMAHWIGPESPPHETTSPALPDASALAHVPLKQTILFDTLRAADVPMTPCVAVSSGVDAAAKAEALSFPVVLKGCADEVPHKTELGLIRLGLRDAGAVRAAYAEIDTILAKAAAASPTREIVVQPMVGDGVELIIAARHEGGFGTVVVVGLGGVLAEFIKSVSVRIGPVDFTEARAMLDECRATEMLAGLRGKGPYDITAAAQAIAALSRLAAAAGPRIGAIEINPLIVGVNGAFGVDALLTPPSSEES